MIPFKEGQRVCLPADTEEGWDRECGEVLGVSPSTGTMVVQLDREFLCGPGDDGLHEMLFEHAQLDEQP